MKNPNHKIQKWQKSNFRLTLQKSFNIPKGESSVFDDFGNFSKKQGLTIFSS
jgi:hypothetical protein